MKSPKAGICWSRGRDWMKAKNKKYGIKKFKISVNATVIPLRCKSLKAIKSIIVSRIVARNIIQRSKTGVIIGLMTHSPALDLSLFRSL